MKKLFTTFLFFAAHLLLAQDNKALQEMANQDQNSRAAGNINWVKLNTEDSLRRVTLADMKKKGLVTTPKDHFNAGIILQHGQDTLASAQAVYHFRTALAGDSTLHRWWYAAAVDRHLMRQNKPQIYGTQYVSENRGKWKRYQIDSTQVTDAQRKYYHVETLAEQAEKERVMNLKSVHQFYLDSKDLTATLALIQEDFNKKESGQYDVQEQTINSFGYALPNKEDALRVFELNTRLYPQAWNTYDSYAETLLALGKIAEAKANYAKSLALNPDNKNAKKVLN